MDAARMEPEGYLTTTVPPIKQTNKQTNKKERKKEKEEE